MGFIRNASQKQKLQIFPQSVGHIIWTTSNCCITFTIMYCTCVHESITMNKVNRLAGGLHNVCMLSQGWGLAGDDAGCYSY